jgi:hypothetical protein
VRADPASKVRSIVGVKVRELLDAHGRSRAKVGGVSEVAVVKRILGCQPVHIVPSRPREFQGVSRRSRLVPGCRIAKTSIPVDVEFGGTAGASNQQACHGSHCEFCLTRFHVRAITHHN